MKLASRYMKAEKLRPTTLQQYELAVNTLRKVFPESRGPADITPAMAEEFKVIRIEKGRKPRTVENDISNLSIVYGHWFRDKLKITDNNPFADVDRPKEDKRPPRFVTDEELQAFYTWLTERWAWRLPVLFLETKAAVGCRIGELSAALSANLRDGRLYFSADTTKGREERACLLPTALYEELRASAGPIYVFQRFSEELKAAHRLKGHYHPANAVKEFTPARLKRWIQREAKTYFEKTEASRFKLHNLRGTAMSRARLAGVSEDDAAIAFDCTPATMREHYLAFDKARVADRVFQRIQNGDKASSTPAGTNGDGAEKNGVGGAVGAQEPANEKRTYGQSP